MEELFKSDKVLQFWPTDKQSPKERAYATTRFILYASCILYIIRRDVRILLVAASALFAVYYMYKNGMIKETEYKYVKKSTKENPMNNGLDGPPDRSSLKAVWDQIHPFMEGRWFAEHNFYTAPTVDNEQFIKGTYSNLMMPVCRDNPQFCNPESSMGRGPEWIQRKTFERL